MLPYFDQDHLALQSRVRAWVDKHLLNGAEGKDIEAQARRLVKELAREGFVAYVTPKRFGGVRETIQSRDWCLLREELARGSALADTMLGMQALGSYPITL